MNRTGQLDLKEIASLIIVGIFLLIALPIITLILNAAAGGNIENSVNAIVAAFIPLFFFAIIFEIIRRLFG